MEVQTPGGMKKILFVGVLWMAVMASAVAVIYATHVSRNYFGDLEAEKDIGYQLNVEQNRLLLEKSTWSSNRHVQDVAKRQLHMVSPAPAKTEIVHP